MSLLNDILKKISSAAEYSAEDPANLLKIIGTVGFAVSCICQTIAVATNDKVPSNEKKFLVPQEIADGAVNTGLFFTFTALFNKAGEWLVKNAKVLPKSLEQYKSKDQIEKILNGTLHVDEKIAGKLTGHLNGMKVLMGLIGSIISANLITPIIRNKIAAEVQKKLAVGKLDLNVQPVNLNANLKVVNNTVNLNSNPAFNSHKNIANYLNSNKKPLFL